VELLFTYDEEFGGEVGPAWLLRQGLIRTRPDDCGRLQLPGGHRTQRLPADGGDRARQDGPRRHSRHPASTPCKARRKILTALYAQNTLYQQITSQVDRHQPP